jgi:hypothetical protein
MAATAEQTLGRQLLVTLEDVNGLFARTSTREELDQVDQQRARLLHLIGTLIDRNLDSGTQEYLAATRGLQDASVQIRLAIRRMEKVAEAITALGQALDLVARLAR